MVTLVACVFVSSIGRSLTFVRDERRVGESDDVAYLWMSRGQRLAATLCGRSFLWQLHCSFELRRRFFNAKIIGVKPINFHQVVGRKWWAIRSLGKFNKLFLVINVRQRRS